MEARENQEAKVRVTGSAGHEILRDLADWLRHERVPGPRAEFRRAATILYEIGGDLLTWLMLIASSRVLAEGILVINAWISTRRTDLVAELEIGGKRIRISGWKDEIQELLAAPR